MNIGNFWLIEFLLWKKSYYPIMLFLYYTSLWVSESYSVKFLFKCMCLCQVIGFKSGCRLKHLTAWKDGVEINVAFHRTLPYSLQVRQYCSIWSRKYFSISSTWSLFLTKLALTQFVVLLTHSSALPSHRILMYF